MVIMVRVIVLLARQTGMVMWELDNLARGITKIDKTVEALIMAMTVDIGYVLLKMDGAEEEEGLIKV